MTGGPERGRPFGRSRRLFREVTGGCACSEGAFDVEDPLAAAAFVLSASEGFDLLHDETGDAARARIDALMTFVLRGLCACEA